MKTYLLKDDGIFDYSSLVEPTSEKQMLGYHAVAAFATNRGTGGGMTTTGTLTNASTSPSD